MQFGRPAEAFGRPGRRPVLLEENARPPGCPHRGAGPTHPLAEGNARSLVIGKHSDADVTTNTTAGTTADYNLTLSLTLVLVTLSTKIGFLH